VALIAGESPGAYVKDLETGTLRAVVHPQGEEPINDPAVLASSISGNGQRVAFASSASNIVPLDSRVFNIYLYDFGDGSTKRLTPSLLRV
jgi:Tol biopolymer transport system component